jgi:hypothetical protein
MPIKEESDTILSYYVPYGHTFVVIEVAAGLCAQKLEAESER